MDLRFHINYHTRYGQRIKVCGNAPVLGSGDASQAPYLEYSDNGDWYLDFSLSSKEAANLEYKYCLEENGEIVWEWGKGRHLAIPARRKTVDIRDFWRPAAKPENAWQSSAFTRVLMAHGDTKKLKMPAGAQLLLRMVAPRVGTDYALCVVGSDPALGAWKEEDALVMNAANFPVWAAGIKLKNPDLPLDYKYAIYDVKAKKVVTWEDGENRRIEAIQENDLHVITDEKFKYPVGNWKGAGVAVPVFSLRSKHGLGVGEFADLVPFIDWAADTGLKMVQILPVNDTIATHTWTDSYPYAAISVFALHPMFLNMEEMGKVKNSKITKALKEDQERLNALEQIDYEAVMDAKWRYIRALYKQERAAFLKDAAFKTFFKNNRDKNSPIEKAR